MLSQVSVSELKGPKYESFLLHSFFSSNLLCKIDFSSYLYRSVVYKIHIQIGKSWYDKTNFLLQNKAKDKLFPMSTNRVIL